MELEQEDHNTYLKVCGYVIFLSVENLFNNLLKYLFKNPFKMKNLLKNLLKMKNPLKMKEDL